MQKGQPGDFLEEITSHLAVKYWGLNKQHSHFEQAKARIVYVARKYVS